MQRRRGDGGIQEIDREAYSLPDDGWPRLLNVSGGRSSAYLLKCTLDAHGGRLPSYARAVFCNTGKERSETLEFVRSCQEKWNVDITWLEYDYLPNAGGGVKDPKHVHKVVDYQTASRDGEPFAKLIRATKILPHQGMRKCTSELKVNTVKRWCQRELGWSRHKDVLGIRYDEPRRWRKALMEECRTEYPLVSGRVTEQQVERFWKVCSFDLGIPSSLSNCDLCFLKGTGNLVGVIRKEPERAEWWAAQEMMVQKKLRRRRWRSLLSLQSVVEYATFSKKRSYRDLVEMARGRLPFNSNDDGQAISCFCGD